MSWLGILASIEITVEPRYAPSQLFLLLLISIAYYLLPLLIPKFGMSSVGPPLQPPPPSVPKGKFIGL